jgi:hypothetical protein
MHRKLSIFLSVALGAALLVAPSVSNIGSDSIYDSAFAAKGGNGKGNGANKSSNAGGDAKTTGGNSNSNGGNKSASLGATSVGKSKEGKTLTSQMGALNAAHASAQAFANPNPNSRVGRIKEAIIQNAAAEAAVTAAATAAATAQAANAAVAAKQQEITDLTTAIADPLTNPADLPGLQTQLDAANAALPGLQATATAANDAAALAQSQAVAAQAISDAAWDAAANKTVTDEVKQATIDLVGDKVDTSAVTAPAPTPTP